MKQETLYLGIIAVVSVGILVVGILWLDDSITSTTTDAPTPSP